MDRGAELIDRLRALPPDKQALALERLAARGIDVDLEPAPTRAPEAPDALTVKQEALWHLHAAGDSGDFYHVGVVFECAERLPPEHWAGAFLAAAGRHEALRTGYPADAAGQPRARVFPAEVVSPQCLPVRVSSRAEALAVAYQRTLRMGRLPFDLSRPPVRALLVDARPYGVLLGVVAHDIAADRYGLRTVLGPDLINGLASDDDPPLRPADLAAWQRRSLASGELRQQVERRRADLIDLPQLQWPVTADRTAGTVPVRLDGQDWQLLGTRAAAAGASRFSVVLCAWAQAVSVALGLPEVAIGCCTSGRHRPQLTRVLGNLANTLLVRLGPDTGSDSAEALQRVHRQVAAVLADADAPLETVLAPASVASAGGRSIGAVPDESVHVRLTFHDEPVQDTPVLAVHDVDFGWAKSALSLECSAGEDSLTGRLDYRPSVVPRERATELVADLHRRLRRIALTR